MESVHIKQIEALVEKARNPLDTYIALVKRWQNAVNLVSSNTIPDIWKRHVLDSAQLFPLLPQNAGALLDMGSGAGFPGVVLAILNKELRGPLKQVILVESDLKKSLFLKEVVRVLDLNVDVRNQRAESIEDISVPVVTARALADLNQLLLWGRKFITPNTTCLFLKGAAVDNEIRENRVNCCIEKTNSIVNSEGCVLKISKIDYGVQ